MYWSAQKKQIESCCIGYFVVTIPRQSSGSASSGSAATFQSSVNNPGVLKLDIDTANV